LIYIPFIEYFNLFNSWNKTEKLAYFGILRQTKCLRFISELSNPVEQENVFGGANEACIADLKTPALIVTRDKVKIKSTNEYVCYGESDRRLVGETELKNSCIFRKPSSGKGVTSVTLNY
jgi:hypothetical protein